MESFLVPAGCGEAELVEKRSRFIGRVWPVENEAEAVARIKEMREKHWDATHNVYAYIIRENGIMRYSDDGEPGGTSGMPTLNVFRAEKINNVCCVITRYFGGILLGAGGLVRAYSAAAKLALDAAGVSRMDMWDELLISCSYAQYERVRRLLESTEPCLKTQISAPTSSSRPCSRRPRRRNSKKSSPSSLRRPPRATLPEALSAL